MIKHHAVVLACILSMACVAQAGPIGFTGMLSGANEVAPTASPGTGSATFVLDPVLQTLSVDITFSGLLGAATASNVFCCTAPGTNAAAATTVPAFAGFPLGVTSGTYNAVLDLTMASSYNPAFVVAEGGTTASAEAVVEAGLEAGLAYLNIHTTMFPGGEVRANLEPVPEPISATLLVAGLAGLFALRHKRRIR